jgi:hypothetical protein
MKNFLQKLWRDESGEATGLSLILLYTILVLGATVGLVTLRNQIVQEYGDLSVALDSLNQNWFISSTGVGWEDDTRIFGNPPANDPPNQPPANLVFSAPDPETP